MPESITERARDAIVSRAELPGMSLMEHLEELRKRIIWSVVSLLPAAAVVWNYHQQIFAVIERPIVQSLQKHHLEDKLIVTSPTDAFNLYIKLSIVGGIFLASPFILYQIWLFISPALYRNEKRFVVPFMLATVALFLGGGYFGYRVVFPFALDFLLEVGEQFRPLITVGEYISLFTTVILGLGIVFEEPVLVFFLALMGVVTAGWLWRNIRYAILVAFVVAAIITPTPDVMNMCILAAPMIGLYIISIGVAALANPQRRKRDSEART